MNLFYLDLFLNVCGKNIFFCTKDLLFLLTALIILVFFVIRYLFFLLKRFWKIIIERIKNYGENRLVLRTFRRLGYNTFKLLYHQYVQQTFINPVIKRIYYPSIPSLLTTIAIVILLFFIPDILKPPVFVDPSHNEFLTYLDSNHYQNFIAIHGGIGAIILAFLILIAESSEFGKNHNRARLILKETWLFPLATLEILSLFLFTLGNKNLSSILSIFLIGLLTIRAIYKVTELFINRFILQEKEQELINDRFSSSLDQAVKERLQNNTLIAYLDQSKYAIDYSYFSSSARNNKKIISLSKKGILADINLGKLEKLLNHIEKVANTYGLSIRKNPLKDKKAGRVSRKVSPQLIDEKYTSVEVLLLKLSGYPLTDDDQKILAIPKKLYEDKELREKIEREVKGIFNIKPQDSAKKEIRLELDETKDKAFEAIVSSKVGVLSAVMSIYTTLIDKFLSVFKTYGGGYSSEAARKERSSLFGGWEYTKWIQADLRDVISEAIKSKKDQIIKEVVNTPIQILYKAYVERDHLIFQEFIIFQSFLYWEAKEELKDEKDEKIRKELIRRSTDYLSEFAEYRITPELEDPEVQIEDITQIRDFVYEILQAYKTLLKYSLDKRDVTSFTNYLTDAKNILHRFDPKEEHRKLQIEIQLRTQNITEEARIELESELKKVNILEETQEQIKDKKLELIFGFSAWCLYKLKESNFANEEYLSMWNNLLPALPTQIDHLIEIYEVSSKHTTQSYWGWDWWELEEKRGDNRGLITGTVEIDSKLNTLFVILLLKALKGKTKDQINTTNIKIDHDMRFYFEKDDSLIKSHLRDIVSNQISWEKILTPEEVQAAPLVVEILDELVEKYIKEEEVILANTQIDNEKVTEFINNFVSGYESSLGIRKLLNIFNMVVLLKEVSKSEKYWGFNEIQDKEPFLKSPNVDHGDFGEHYGRGLADSEDQIIFGEIKQRASSKQTKQSLSEAVITASEELVIKGYTPSIIFTTFHIGDWRKVVFNNKEFTPAYKLQDSKYRGISDFLGQYRFGRRKIPVFRFWIPGKNDDKPEIIVADINKFMSLEQYPPYTNDTEKQKMQIKGYFAFQITDLSSETNKELRDKLIRENPPWLQQYTDKEFYLKQKVIVHVKEKYEIKIKDKDAAIKTIIDTIEEE